jgi:hypothetical protein
MGNPQQGLSYIAAWCGKTADKKMKSPASCRKPGFSVMLNI